MRVWFRVVAPHRARLADSTPGARLALWRQSQGAIMAAAWEELCRQAVPRLHLVDEPSAELGPWQTASRYWSGNEPEWDVVAHSEDRHRVLLGEGKWMDRPPSRREICRLHQQLARKQAPQTATAVGCKPVLVLFLPHCEDSQRWLQEGIRVVTAAKVLKALRY